MQQTPFGRIIAFVEGSMERIFLNKNFTYVDVVTVPNGETWSIDRLANQIGSLYKAKNANPDRIFVWFDREKRQEEISSIKSSVETALVAAGAPAERIRICIPDRMTENFILADEVLIRSQFGNPEYNYAGDGSHGKAILKALYDESGVSYKETYHGSELLKKTHISRSASASTSAKEFCDIFDLQCWWNR